MILRQVAIQMLPFTVLLSSSFMIWKSLCLMTNSSFPILVVLSGSMEPTFQRGDILVLWNRTNDVQVGAIVVFTLSDRESLSVHRVVRKYGEGNHVKILTKGDYNEYSDEILYPGHQEFLALRDIVGNVVGYIPRLGYTTILLSENQWLKLMLIGTLGIGCYVL
ncbi:hypothetical protein WAI453_010298 [Rhynchosporium graminicola]